MKWYEDLFVGESVTGKIKKIKWKIEHNAGMLHTYIITFPSNEENLLDIIPTRELLQKGYPKKNLHIIAVAGNYDEALLLACDIVKETYENTGKTDVKIKKIKWKIEHNAGMLHTYIITFPSNEENLLDIIPTRELLQKGYPKKNLHIIAVAGNYDEALLLACDIVKETYENTGKTDVKSYLKSRRRN